MDSLNTCGILRCERCDDAGPVTLVGSKSLEVCLDKMISTNSGKILEEPCRCPVDCPPVSPHHH